MSEPFRRRPTGRVGLPALLLAAAVAAAGLPAAPATAQQAPDAGPAAGAPAYGDAKLESYVAAAIGVSRVVGVWRPRLEAAQAAGDAEALNVLRRRATAAMADVVERADGISVPEYRAITEAAQRDAALRGRIRDLMTAAGRGEG